MSGDGQAAYVACGAAKQVVVWGTSARRAVRTMPLALASGGVALSGDGKQLFVTCGGLGGEVRVLDTASGRVVQVMQAGHTPVAPVVSPDGRSLYVCNRFDNDVSVFDLSPRPATDSPPAPRNSGGRIPVQREPVAADVSRDGRFLFVANHLPVGRADDVFVGACVSVIDLQQRKVVKELQLPMGAGLLKDLRVSPDGRHAAVTHLLARYYQPAAQVERGWMNANALTVIDVARRRIVNTVLLDDANAGAANPWGLAWTRDSQTLVVAHAGVHEVSVIDFGRLLAKLDRLPSIPGETSNPAYSGATQTRADVPHDPKFLAGLRRRVKLPATDRGPRALVVAGQRAYVTGYFSDTMSVIDLASGQAKVESAPLGNATGAPRLGEALSDAEGRDPAGLVRRGEAWFNDATLCHEGWQSCASCHPDGRADGLNWDLLNDGPGNPKNTRSLLLAHRTPPAMSLGVRETAETAVRAGFRHILFREQPEPVAQAVDAYLKSLQPVPGPRQPGGQFSEAAKRGQTLFKDPRVGCAGCHPPGLFTTLRRYDVGTARSFDGAARKFDTPTLVEVWRTAPYLHDGSAATLRDVLTTQNPEDRHGTTSHLAPAALDDLVEYLRGL